MQKGRILKEDIETKKKEFTFDELKGLEDELYLTLGNRDIFPNECVIEASNDKDSDITIELEIEGDWKHDHLYCDRIVEKEFCRDNDFIITHEDEEEVGDSQSDSYKSIHTYKCKYFGK